jgi:hypothetical protein
MPGEAVYANINISYSDNTVESNMDSKLAISVTGGELLAFGSANPRSEDSFGAGEYTTYYGRSLAIVRCGGSGAVSIRADARNDLGFCVAQILVKEFAR